MSDKQAEQVEQQCVCGHERSQHNDGFYAGNKSCTFPSCPCDMFIVATTPPLAPGGSELEAILIEFGGACAIGNNQYNSVPSAATKAKMQIEALFAARQPPAFRQSADEAYDRGYKQGVADEIECMETSGEHLAQRRADGGGNG